MSARTPAERGGFRPSPFSRNGIVAAVVELSAMRGFRTGTLCGLSGFLAVLTENPVAMVDVPAGSSLDALRSGPRGTVDGATRPVMQPAAAGDGAGAGDRAPVIDDSTPRGSIRQSPPSHQARRAGLPVAANHVQRFIRRDNGRVTVVASVELKRPRIPGPAEPVLAHSMTALDATGAERADAPCTDRVAVRRSVARLCEGPGLPGPPSRSLSLFRGCFTGRQLAAAHDKLTVPERSLAPYDMGTARGQAARWTRDINACSAVGISQDDAR